MPFYHGFALKGETHFFEEHLEFGAYVVSGFSYGAIKAFKHVLNSKTRVDKLQLFSPAFFQNRSDKYRRLQIIGYKKNSALYIEKFLENCFLPYGQKDVTLGEHSAEALEELLHYEWNTADLQKVLEQGTEIEVYLGGDDKISDVRAAYDFFLPFATVTLLKRNNHFLQGEDR